MTRRRIPPRALSRLAIVLVTIALATILEVEAHAQEAAPDRGVGASHFSYTGELRSGGAAVATVAEAPLSRARFRHGDAVDVVVHGEGFTLTAEGTRAGLGFHVHGWTLATVRGFRALVPPDTRLEVREGSTERAVVFPAGSLGEGTLGRAATLPAWLATELAEQRMTSCRATRLHPRPHEGEGDDALALPEGTSLHVRPATDASRSRDLDEAWVLLDGLWVRGYARGVACDVEDAGELGMSLAGVSSSTDPPPHVLLPVGLVLVSPAHPERPVLRVSRPVDAIDWGPGWTAANDEGALSIALPCGLGELVGHLRFTPSQLVPRGAPPR